MRVPSRPVFLAIAATALCFILSTGCTSDNDPVRTTPPVFVSDIAPVVHVYHWDVGDVLLYSYYDVTFLGDIRLAEYDAARADMASRARDGEVLLSVSNFREFPPGFLVSDPTDRIELKTCTSSMERGCMAGMIYRYVREDDDVVFLDSESWHIRREDRTP